MAMVILDAIHYNFRDNGIVTKEAAYVAIGTDLEGRKDVLGIWLGTNESAKYWLSVLNGLKNRGVSDILIASVDGLIGFVEAINMYNKYVSEKLGLKKISAIKYTDILKFYNSLITDLGFKPNSMEIIHTILHPIFTVAVRDGYIRTNPTDNVMSEIKKSHNWEKSKRHALTVQQQSAFMTFLAENDQYRNWLPLFKVFLGTGCRVGEIIGLRWEDCNFENNLISINHNLIYRQQNSGKCEYHITTPKTKTGIRIIPMLSEVKDALLEEYEKQSKSGFNETVIDGYSGFVFKNRFGTVFSPHSINRVIARIVSLHNEKEAEKAQAENREPQLLPHFSVHNLRHTFCTRFCENETNIKIIQEIMGHADITTTMDIYNEATIDKKKESFANLEGKIKLS